VYHLYRPAAEPVPLHHSHYQTFSNMLHGFTSNITGTQFLTICHAAFPNFYATSHNMHRGSSQNAMRLLSSPTQKVTFFKVNFSEKLQKYLKGTRSFVETINKNAENETKKKMICLLFFQTDLDHIL
jgi:hypothetical protein